MPSDLYSWRTASWLVMNRTPQPLSVKLERMENGHEASRPDRTRFAQFARIGSSEFADHHWHLSGRGFAGGDALSGYRPATAGVAAFDEIRPVRYCRCHFAS